MCEIKLLLGSLNHLRHLHNPAFHKPVHICLKLDKDVHPELTEL